MPVSSQKTSPAKVPGPTPVIGEAKSQDLSWVDKEGDALPQGLGKLAWGQKMVVEMAWQLSKPRAGRSTVQVVSVELEDEARSR